MKRSILAATVTMLMLFGITALARTPQAPAHTPTPTPSTQDGVLPPSGTDQNDQGDMNVEGGPDMTEPAGPSDAKTGQSGLDEAGNVEQQNGDANTGDSQSGAQQDGEFEGDN